MSHPLPPAARSSPSTVRNREPILAALREILPPDARVLEVASGAGEHAVFAAEHLPDATWLPTDPDAEALASIAAWRAASDLANLAPPGQLDVTDEAAWPAGPFDAVVCINMIHIAPWTAAQALLAGAARVLRPGGVLYLYGPYLEDGVETAPSNLGFDADLKRRNPAWGLRRLEAVKALAARDGLTFARRIAMPANNLSLVFAKA
jgi:SAM-dependent methyltransferase